MLSFRVRAAATSTIGRASLRDDPPPDADVDRADRFREAVKLLDFSKREVSLAVGRQRLYERLPSFRLDFIAFKPVATVVVRAGRIIRGLVGLVGPRTSKNGKEGMISYAILSTYDDRG